MSEELDTYLEALDHDECYRVDRTLKEGPNGSTEIVYFVGANNAERGPFIRKKFPVEKGLGGAYERIWEAQKEGKRFAHLPHIEECYNTGECFVVVHEYVKGQTLADVVFRRDPSPSLAADLFPQLCEAVSELHTEFEPPIIHRDLKPMNIIMSNDVLTIIDFGIARTYKASRSEDTVQFGTRAYASPEQFGFGQTDVRSDIYTLGLLLYYLLTEKIPDAEARDQGFHAKNMPEPLRLIIVKATSLDPADRYASVAELMEAFDEALDELDVERLESGDDSEEEGQGRKTLLSMVPKGVGIAWNVFLILCLLVLLGSCLASPFDIPEGSVYKNVPFMLTLLMYILTFIFVFVPGVFMFCDRRMFYRSWPKLKETPVIRQLAICIVIMAIAMLVIGLLVSLFSSWFPAT